MKNKYLLVQYNKFQSTASETVGKIIMRGKNCNGFFEKILEIGFAESVFAIQYEDKDGIRWEHKINRFEEDKIKSESNERLAKTVSDIMNLVESVKVEQFSVNKKLNECHQKGLTARQKFNNERKKR